MSLWTIAEAILQAELQGLSNDSTSSWLQRELQELQLKEPDGVPAWSNNSSLSLPLSDIVFYKLRLLFEQKLIGEEHRHTAGRHKANDDEIFSETDRIVKRLLTLSGPPSPDQGMLTMLCGNGLSTGNAGSSGQSAFLPVIRLLK